VNLLGIEIGGSKLQLVQGDEHGRIVQRQRLAVDRAKGGAGIRELIAAAVREWRKSFTWRGVGCGYGGPVDWTNGKIHCSHQVEGWDDFPLANWLRELCGAPVRVDNDSNTAALGEALFGAGAGCSPLFYTNSGSGVGGGLVLHGRIYHGAPPGEAELGHVRLDKAGTLVEDRCSGWAVDKRIRALRQVDPHSVLARLIGDAPGGEARHLSVALERGDPAAERILRETADDLAFALSHVAQLFHPEVIVLGGGLALLGEPWRSAVAGALPHYVMAAFAPGPQVKLAALGEDVVPAGALALAAVAARTA
jgi:glucokinase